MECDSRSKCSSCSGGPCICFSATACSNKTNRSSYFAGFVASCLAHTQPLDRLCMVNTEVLCPLPEASEGSRVELAAVKV